MVAKIKMKKPKIRKCAPMEKYKLNKLDSDETRTTLKNVIGAKLQQENGVEQGIEDMWGDFKRKMIEAADEVLGEKIAYRGKKKMTPWWTDDIRDAVKRKMVRFRKWMKSQIVMQFEKNTFVFFEKNCFL